MPPFDECSKMNCPECNSQEITTISYPSEGNRQEFFCRTCRHRWRPAEPDSPLPHEPVVGTSGTSRHHSKKSLRNRRRKLRKLHRRKMGDEFGKAMEQAKRNAELSKGTGKVSLGGPLDGAGEDFWGFVKRVHED